MIIDFHTHIFPKKIAEKALGNLSATANVKPFTNGMEGGLLSSMEKSGVNTSIILPVVTGVKQFDSIIRFAVYINETYSQRNGLKLISIGGIHPNDEDYKERLSLIKNEGLKGIKLHPHYQGVEFNSIKTKRIIDRANELGLFVITHAGFDPISPEKDFCTPEMIVDVVNDVKPEKLALAHFGSNLDYKTTEERICGLNVYLDTAYTMDKIDTNCFERIVKNHGADKILFASDSPWADQKSSIEAFNRANLSEEERELILHKNAEKLMNI